jgi:hypothetical protein
MEKSDLAEARIIEEIRTIRQADRKVRIQDVVSAVGMSREHLGPRYKHCFR